jgi:hypothetical protein
MVWVTAVFEVERTRFGDDHVPAISFADCDQAAVAEGAGRTVSGAVAVAEVVTGRDLLEHGGLAIVEWVPTAHTSRSSLGYGRSKS